MIKTFVFLQKKRGVKKETIVDNQEENNERLLTNRSDTQNPSIVINNNQDFIGNNFDNIPPRSRVNTLDDQQQVSKVQFITSNNFFKNVTDNKDIAKLNAQLATCINATKKVSHTLYILISIFPYL